MGHSMDSGTTCNVAMEYPDLPKAIVLEDPAWGMFPPKPGNAAKLWKSKAPFKWIYIQDAGHSVCREQYAAFKKALYDWLDTLK